MRNDSRVAQVNIGAAGVNFDFTDTTKTYELIEAAFKEVRDVLWITNNCEREAVYYISREIASNFERHSSEFVSSSNKIIQPSVDGNHKLLKSKSDSLKQGSNFI